MKKKFNKEKQNPLDIKLIKKTKISRNFEKKKIESQIKKKKC